MIKNLDSFLLKISLFIAFFFSYNRSILSKLILPTRLWYMVLIGAAILCALSVILGCCHNPIISVSSYEVAWLTVLVICISHNQDLSHGNSYHFILFAVCVAFMVLLVHSADWFEWVAKLIYGFTLFHAITTLLCYFVPDFYTNYILVLFTDDDTYNTLIRWYNNGFMAGITSHYSTNGMYLGIGATVLMCGFLFESKKTMTNSIFTVITLLALLLVGKRAHVIFAITTILFVYFLYNKEKIKTFFKIIFIIAGGSMTLLILSSYIPALMNVVTRFQESIASGDITSGRDNIAKYAIELFNNHIWTGIGWGGFKYIYPPTSQGILLDVHNIYLQLLCETGILSGIFIISLLLCTWLESFNLLHLCVQTNRHLPEFQEYGLVVSISIQTFFLLYCFTGNPLYDIQTLLPYTIACAYFYRLKISIAKRRNNLRIK